MRVIINADDLGIRETVNNAIFDLLARGSITSSTLMANGPAFAQAAARAAEFPHCSFGVHLNLTSFESLSRHPGFGGYLDADGRFRGNVRKCRIDRPFREAVRVEWAAQVGRVLDHGVSVSHLDSHHHVHTIASLFVSLKRVQREYGIRRVRISRNLYAVQSPRLKVRLCAKAAWNFALRHYGSTRTTDGFTDLADFVELVARRTPRYQTVELMVHPGDPAFAPETALVDGPWRERVRVPIELVSYHAL